MLVRRLHEDSVFRDFEAMTTGNVTHAAVSRTVSSSQFGKSLRILQSFGTCLQKTQLLVFLNVIKRRHHYVPPDFVSKSVSEVN
jgi:hypothetical protein